MAKTFMEALSELTGVEYTNYEEEKRNKVDTDSNTYNKFNELEEEMKAILRIQESCKGFFDSIEDEETYEEEENHKYLLMPIIVSLVNNTVDGDLIIQFFDNIAALYNRYITLNKCFA